MRSFLLGFFGALTCLVMAAIGFPLYSDYQAASETSRWMGEITPIQRQIEEAAMKQNTLIGSGQKIEKTGLNVQGANVLEVMDSGVILVQGGRAGQVIVLAPKLTAGKVSWRCIGGSAKAVVSVCRG